MPDRANSEHRAMGWAAIGGGLMSVGALAGISVGLWGAGSHLWNDDYFLAGFTAALFLAALGFYILWAEFIGGIGPIKFPLPPTRREREVALTRDIHSIPPAKATANPHSAIMNQLIRRLYHEHRGRRSVIDVLPPAERERILRENAGDTPASARPSEYERYIQRGDDLVRKIKEAKARCMSAPESLAEDAAAELTAEVDAWRGDVGGYVLPKLDKGWRTGLAQLRLYVERELAAMRARQGR